MSCSNILLVSWHIWVLLGGAILLVIALILKKRSQ